MTPAPAFPFSLPEPKQNNFWYHYNDSDTVIVFVHGIFSDSRGCWLHEDVTEPDRSAYWPALIMSDPRLGDPAIYMAGYYTAVDSGPYQILNCADEILKGFDRPDREGRPGPMSRPTIIFICHSTGGIVARYLLEANQARFASKKLGLILIASPSAGSQWADRLGLIAMLYNQQLGQQLQWKNWSLGDLDARFKNLVSQHRLPGLRGVEAYENHFVLHRAWLPSTTVVVTQESAGRYFGAPVLLRNTDHFTCVKPDGLDHASHELLVDFWTNDVTKPAGYPDVVMEGFVPERLDVRLEQTRRLRMLVMRSNSWFAGRQEWLMQRIREGKLELEVLLPEPSNKSLMMQLRSMYDEGLSPDALAQSIRAVIARLLLMRAALPPEFRNKLNVATHEYYPPYSAYLFDDNELWYIPYHRKAHKLPVFVYSGTLSDVPVYRDFSSLPVWRLTGDEWRGRLGTFARSLLEDLLQRNSPLAATLKQSRDLGSRFFVFGGFVRDAIHAFVHSQQLEPRDLDLVVDGTPHLGSGMVNHFGGIKWQAEGLRVDCWDLASTHAFQRALVTPATLTNLPRTTVYRLNGCYLSLEDGTLHGEEAIADIFARQISFNCKSYLDKYPEYQAFRAIDLAERLGYEIDDEVKEFIAQALRAAGAARFEQQVREHRPELEPSLLRARFDRYSNG